VTRVLRCSGYDVTEKEIVRARGCTLVAADGRRYVDFESGVWAAGLGHNHPRINRAIAAQLERISHIGYRVTNSVVEEAAATVLDTLALSDGKCVFLSSGSEAVEFAVQIARRITGKPLLLTLADSYLAAYGSAGRKSAEEWICFDWGACRACPQARECSGGCPHLAGIPVDRVGGLVFEPGSSGGCVRFPPAKLVRALRDSVRDRGGLVLANEVTTGMGRTGAWYGFEHYDLRPDIVALGKGLGNGYPVSAVAMTDAVVDRLTEVGFRYAQSHQNDPLGCAVAKEAIAIIREEGLVRRSADMGARFLGGLRLLAERHDAVGEARGRGLMLAMEFVADDGGNSLALTFNELLASGFLVGYKPAARLLRFFPPLTIGEREISDLVERLDRILDGLS